MRVAVVSDIHSNITALNAVLLDAAPFDELWCLGDIVGYGPEPNACVRSIRDRPHRAVAGNHEWAALGRIGLEQFNPLAAAAARWTIGQLSDDVRSYLQALPLRLVEKDFTLVHGSPREPTWEYILDQSVASANFAHFQTTHCLVGHTHIPSFFARSGKNTYAQYATADLELDLTTEDRFILNPGSVGQPRDDDPRASYLLLDVEKRRAVWRRVEYDITATQQRMMELQLPERLIARLALGR